MSDWRTLPGIPGYVFNTNTGVLVSPFGKLCKLTGNLNNAYSVRMGSGKKTTLTIETLLKKARRGDVVPNPLEYESLQPITMKKRKCHDCGRLTWDYRCPECLSKWRAKHGVPQNADGSVSFDIVYYGSVAKGTGKHVHQE